MMKKGKFIYGDGAVGKTILAGMFAELYKKPAIISNIDLEFTYWENVTTETDLIIIEGYIPDRSFDEQMIGLVSHGIRVNRKGYPLFSIEPDFIVISQYRPSKLIAGSRHFHVVKMGAKHERDYFLFNLNRKNNQV